MIIDRDSIFSIGGQIAKLVAICDEDGNSVNSVEQYDSKTRNSMRYATDENGEVIFDPYEQPLMELVKDKQLFFIVTIDPPQPGAEVFEPSKSEAPKE